MTMNSADTNFACMPLKSLIASISSEFFNRAGIHLENVLNTADTQGAHLHAYVLSRRGKHPVKATQGCTWLKGIAEFGTFPMNEIDYID